MYADYQIDLMQKDVRNYLQHGGKFWETEASVFTNIFVKKRIGNIEWIPDFLFNASEPWLADELSSLQICCIGTLAHVDAAFCDRLKKDLTSYYSPPSLRRTPSADHLFESIFGLASIQSHFRTLVSNHMYGFLSLLCRTGSVAMVTPFIDLGVDVNGGNWYDNMLGNAAALGNVDIVKMLLEAGANGSLAIRIFLDSSKCLPDPLFRSLLESLVENARPWSFNYFNDPLFAAISSNRALRCYPEAPKNLLDRDIFTKKGFGEPALATSYYDSYMYQAILQGRSSLVDLLLRKGACADARISHSFDCKGELFESWTWLTFAVMCGEASCTDVLIQHGADITALDGDGKSAIHLAKQNAMASHPRCLMLFHYHEDQLQVIGAEPDAETLAVVEQAFNHRFQGTMSIEGFLNSSKEITPQPPSPPEKSTPKLQKTFETALGIFLTPSQTKRLLNYFAPLYHDTQKTWSLPFHEALLMRSMYVLSYAILFIYEVHALIKGHKRIPMPSRFFMSALALLALAVICGTSSQGGFGWGFFGAAGKEAKMGSGG